MLVRLTFINIFTTIGIHRYEMEFYRHPTKMHGKLWLLSLLSSQLFGPTILRQLGLISPLEPLLVCTHTPPTRRFHNSIPLSSTLTGCAILYSKAKFQCLAAATIDYDAMEACPPTQQTGNVGMMVALEFNEPEKGGKVPGVIVATTHLYWRPESYYERLRQVMLLRERMVRFRREVEEMMKRREGGKKGWPMFLAGGEWVIYFLRLSYLPLVYIIQILFFFSKTSTPLPLIPAIPSWRATP